MRQIIAAIGLCGLNQPALAQVTIVNGGAPAQVIVVQPPGPVVMPAPPPPVLPTPEPPSPACRPGAVVATFPPAMLNVRIGPGVEFPAVDVLPEGAPVSICGRVGNWGRLPSGAWVSLRFVIPVPMYAGGGP